MKKIKRILAMAGVVILVGMYVMTLVSAAMVTPHTQSLFWASVGATIIIPIILYAYSLIYRVMNDKNELPKDIAQEKEDKKETKQ